MQRMQMRMKHPLKHDTRYAQYFANIVQTLNDLKPLKAVITKRATSGIWQGSEHTSSFAKLYI